MARYACHKDHHHEHALQVTYNDTFIIPGTLELVIQDTWILKSTIPSPISSYIQPNIHTLLLNPNLKLYLKISLRVITSRSANAVRA